MNDPMAVLTIVAGLLVRFGLPLIVMLLTIQVLRRLDAYWQAQGQLQAPMPLVMAGPRCWEVRGCSEQNRARCPAYLHPDAPCWQNFRDRDGNLRPGCLVCDFFRAVPAPEGVPASAMTARH
jgi:hypothetical protein